MIVEQRVQVEILGAYRPYSYAWEFDPLDGGKPLQIGDKVEIPPNQVQEEGSSGEVVAIGTDYKGELKKIVRVIERHDEKQWGAPGAPADDDLWGGFGEGRYA